MKVYIKTKIEDAVKVSEITTGNIVCAIINGNPCILSKGYSESSAELTFFLIDDGFTRGNGFNVSRKYNTIEKMVKYAIEGLNATVEVFEQKDWKEALTWLINNAL